MSTSRSTPRARVPLVQAIDCIRLGVDDLEAASAFYSDALGHEIAWRSHTAVALRLPRDRAELVLQTERPGREIDLLVEDADVAAERFVEAGGRVAVASFDIRIGRCVVVEDPWGNELVLLDARKGSLLTDAEGCVTGTTGSA